MKMNMGRTDRTVRILLAAAIAILYFTKVISGMAGFILLIFAVAFLLTSFVGSCPVYSLLGLSTKEKNKVV